MRRIVLAAFYCYQDQHTHLITPASDTRKAVAGRYSSNKNLQAHTCCCLSREPLLPASQAVPSSLSLLLSCCRLSCDQEGSRGPGWASSGLWCFAAMPVLLKESTTPSARPVPTPQGSEYGVNLFSTQSFAFTCRPAQGVRLELYLERFEGAWSA